MEIQQLHQYFIENGIVCIDTRNIQKNAIFFALKGANFDANSFAEEALQKGACYVVIDNPQYYKNEKTILVEDVLTTLQELASYHREYLSLPIIALTGSNGKTTTKELIQVVLSKKYRTKATVGNLNNHIGVPLTLLSFNQSTEMGIVEMGANHQKEIEFLCSIAKPDYGYVTNFGKAHLEGFGGVDGVIKGKSELYTYLKQHSKTVFVNLDDAIQETKTATMNRVGFSQKIKDNNLLIESVTANPLVSVSFLDINVNSHLIGLYNATNINAAITIGAFFEVDKNQIKEAIESYVPENNRSQLLSKGSNTIILDAYNANPSSVAEAIANFAQLPNEKKIMILGDMFELGNESSKEHLLVVEQVKKMPSVTCYFVGKAFYANRIEQKDVFFFETFESFSEKLVSTTINDAIVLIKGSRGMALERSLSFIK